MMLTANKDLYAHLSKSLTNIFCDIHAIYEPNSSETYPDCFCAGVDLFTPGQTYRVYFSVGEDGQIHVKHLERWFFG